MQRWQWQWLWQWQFLWQWQWQWQWIQCPKACLKQSNLPQLHLLRLLSTSASGQTLFLPSGKMYTKSLWNDRFVDTKYSDSDPAVAYPTFHIAAIHKAVGLFLPLAFLMTHRLRNISAVTPPPAARGRGAERRPFPTFKHHLVNRTLQKGFRYSKVSESEEVKPVAGRWKSRRWRRRPAQEATAGE